MITLHHAVLLGLVLSTGPVALAAGDLVGIDPRIDDRAIVHLAVGQDLASFIALFEADHPGVTLTEVDALPARRMHLLGVKVPPDAPPGTLDLLHESLEIDYPTELVSGEFLYENQCPEGKTGSTYVDGIAEALYDEQYARVQLGLENAHARSRGQGMVIAVLDTGVDRDHPLLAGRIVGGVDFVEPGREAADGREMPNGLDDDGDTLIDEMHGHGTFVAGLIVLTAPDAKIMPIRVLNADGVGDGWILTKGIAYAIDHGVEVINMSLGSTYKTATMEHLLDDQTPDEATAHGIVTVSSAGNFDRSEPEEYPAMSSGIGVAAVDAADVKADFSNFNRDLTIAAPGATSGPAAIVSALPDGDYGVWEGTSFAAPLVSGVAALVRSQHPEWPASTVTAFLVEDVLTATAVDIYAQNPIYAEDEQLGAGRLDAAAAVQLGPPAPESGDLDADGVIGFQDLLSLLEDWGDVHSPADLNGDGVVAFGDLLILLARWG